MKNNIDGFEGEKIECSEFTEKVGKDIIDYKFEYKNNLKIIEMQQKELEIYKEEFKKINKALNLEEGRVEPYTTDIIEGLKRCVTQQHKELETYKKIAEKLAEKLYKNIDMLNMLDVAKEVNYDLEKIFNGLEDEEVIKILLDWARKEVENES